MSDDRPIRSTDTTLPAAPERQREASAGPGAGARRFGYLVSIAINLVMLYLANGVPNWNVPYITNEWPDVLWAINLSLGATIVAHLIFMVYDPRWFRRGLQIGLTVLSLVVFYALYTVFPFDLGRELYEQIARWALLAAVLGLSIAIVVEAIVLLVGRDR